nr:hypothetical protein [Tanacetum cinerariifolium]
MTGIPRSIAVHRLNIREGYSPVRKKIGAGPGARKGDPIRGTKNDRGRNSTRSILPRLVIQPGHGLLPLPEIYWNVESLYGYPFKCFLDAYKGYHQIQMAEQGEEKTDFHTSHGVYCYTKMPFGLKNAGATYQRLVDKAFDRQIAEGLFLGYMINLKGIKPCPYKTEAVLQLLSPGTIKEGHSPDTGLFFEPSAAISLAKLYPNGKASPDAGLRGQKVTQILPGTSHRDFLVEKPDDTPPEASVIETPQDP